MSWNNLLTQDVWLFPLQVCIVALAFVPWLRSGAVRLSGWQMAAATAVVVVLCYLGHYGVLMGYDLARDEQMAVFDSWIFARGQLVWPLPTTWQPFASALNLGFMLPVEHPVAWISSYLPGNAMLRAMVGCVTDPALTGPLTTGMCLPLIWDCARRLWPGDDGAGRDIGAVAALLLATSGQFIITGMTAYAMPAHLLVNLLWLSLFLRRTWQGDAAALAVGFIGTGLHQPIFHPLFVVPWLLLLLADREWRRLAVFVVGYVVICLFWLAWPSAMLGLVAGPHSTVETGVGYGERLASVLHIGWYNVMKGGLNLFRFFCWQNPLVLPFLALGAATTWRDRRCLALIGGIALPFAVLTVIVPNQGHGFGYRYLHGYMGSAVLLAAAGWQEWRRRWPAWNAVPLRGTLLAAAVLLPVQATMARALYRPFTMASAAIDASGASYVIIDEDDGPYARDLVLNRPDLSNRPVRLSYGTAGDFAAMARMICRPGVVVALPTDAFFADMERQMRFFRNRPKRHPSERIAGERAMLRQAGCATILLR